MTCRQPSQPQAAGQGNQHATLEADALAYGISSKQTLLKGIELIVVDAACVVQRGECGKLANNVDAGL